MTVKAKSLRMAERASVTTTKSDAPLHETPQSISVLTREQLDSRGVQSLTDALQTVAGVVTSPYGRRGWDDYIIRGMRSTESVYLDGLKQGTDTWVAQELFGVERVEVLKGPASVNFGLVQPGGLVNQVSKRPLANPLTELGLTVGDHGLRQGTLDVNRPLNNDHGKAAWRLLAMASHSDDPTQHVWFNKRYLAPSLKLDLGPNTDLTLLASYLHRHYIRQQGLPPSGTVLPNANGPIDRSVFAGEPGIGPYEAWSANAGWAFEHRAPSGWTLRQNVRVQRFNVDGRAVFLNARLRANGLQPRNGRLQSIPGHSVMADQHAVRTFTWRGLQHELMFGVDLRRDIVRFGNTNCAVPDLNVYNPVYGGTITCEATPLADDTTRIVDVGVYLRDRIRFNDRWLLSLAARHDHASVSTLNHLTNQELTRKDRKPTSNIGLLYEWTPQVAPYVSWANSFYPVSGTGADRQPFVPETGRQVEAGVKLRSADQRVQGALAVYRLTRENVTAADPVNSGFSIQTGQQRAQGFEAELQAELAQGWHGAATYAFVDSELTRDTGTTRVGRSLDNVPKHSATVQMGRRFTQGALRGWAMQGGLRHESAKRGFTFDYVVPGYTVADAGVSYQANGWRAGLTVKNLFDRETFAGGLNNNVLPMGDPRRMLLNVVFEL